MIRPEYGFVRPDIFIRGILSKASAEAFFSDGHTCTAAQLIYMYSVLCLVYMTVRTQAY